MLHPLFCMLNKNPNEEFCGREGEIFDIQF